MLMGLRQNVITIENGDTFRKQESRVGTTSKGFCLLGVRCSNIC